MPEMLDQVLPFIVERVTSHRETHASRPFFVALNGVQGAGKSTLVTAVAEKLRSPPLSLATAILSIDDFYLPHEEQLALARHRPDNPLIQHRGQPSTHDVDLWTETFKSLRQSKPTKIPQYDKSCFDGQGDRVDPTSWDTVNQSLEDLIQVVIFEGWCVGFRALPDDAVRRMWEEACRERQKETSTYKGRLGWNRLEDLLYINESLRGYDSMNSYYDVLIHLDAVDTHYVYEWRLEQEAALRRSRGRGMTDEQVHRFVDGYYPSYELYTQTLRSGVFPSTGSSSDSSRQLRVVIDKNRKVVEAIRL